MGFLHSKRAYPRLKPLTSMCVCVCVCVCALCRALITCHLWTLHSACLAKITSHLVIYMQALQTGSHAKKHWNSTTHWTQLLGSVGCNFSFRVVSYCVLYSTLWKEIWNDAEVLRTQAFFSLWQDWEIKEQITVSFHLYSQKSVA